ncbi:hypothetical protein K449DRAFT_389940 [Hypoxylon sp. EC38]|nr:hypothetical protein K449DRAFT_389940 [Hypoxylon sp. EC38]
MFHMKILIRRGYHLFPRGGPLLSRIFGPTETEAHLQDSKFWKIPGRQLGRPESDYVFLSVPEDEIRVGVRSLSLIRELSHRPVITVRSHVRTAGQYKPW